VTTARYTKADQSEVEITWDDGRSMTTRLPPTMDIAWRIDAWIAGGGVIAPFAPPVVDLIAIAADARWRKETGGITLAGMPIATDDRSKLMIMGARLAAQSDSQWSTVWVGADGSSFSVDAPTIVQISDAVAAHVNACFATFAEVKAAIEAGTITTPAQVAAAFEG
jgi:hypothetical protein